MEGLKANSRKGEKHCTLEGKRGKQAHHTGLLSIWFFLLKAPMLNSF